MLAQLTIVLLLQRAAERLMDECAASNVILRLPWGRVLRDSDASLQRMKPQTPVCMQSGPRNAMCSQQEHGVAVFMYLLACVML